MRYGIAIVLAIGVSGAASGETFVQAMGYASEARAAEAVLAGVAQEHGVPGMSAAVWANGEIVWSGGVGYADLELQAPVTRESLFRLGSVSKVLTATLAAKLMEEGALDLDADIRSYVPGFPEKEHVITSRQLLGHQGGIRHYGRKDFDPSAPGGMIDLRFYPDTASALALFQDDPLVAAPGTTYAYSTFGYTLLSAALEGAGDGSFLELLEREVLQELGLTNVHGDDMRAVLRGRVGLYDAAQSFLGEEAGSGPYRAFPVNAAYKWAGGGLLANAEDVARFGAAHCAPGLLSQDTLDEMFTKQSTRGGEETIVGLGWRIGQDAAGRRIVHHAGSMGGCRAVLVVWPDDGVAVSMLGNLTGTPGNILDYALEIGAAYVGENGGGE